MTEGSENITRTDYAARRSARALERKAERRRSVPLIVSLALLGVMVLLGAVEAVATSGRIHPGVSVGGVSVGGMKPASARSVLETTLPGRIEEPVVVRHGDKTWKIEAAEIGLGFDYDMMVARAMAVGRDGGALKAIGGRAGAWFGGIELAAIPTSEEVRTRTVLDKIASSTDVAPTDASVTVSGTDIQAVAGEDGLALDRVRVRRAILSAMLATDRTVDAPVAVRPMDVTLEDAEAAATVARRLIDGPVVVTHGEGSWKFDPADVARLVAFRRSDAPTESIQADEAGESHELTPTAGDITLVAYISPKAVAKHVVPVVGAQIGRPAKNARFKTAAGRVTIIPSEEGIGPDVDALAADMTTALMSDVGERTVALKTTKSQPEITTEKAREMGIVDRIARYTTTYSASNRPRVNNIHLLGDALDGKLIAPGKTFSFNGAIGERTAAKGYQEAGAIVNGKLVPQLGGGICQVGTTLFNAVYESGLPVVARRNHSFYIDHYPKGRDATVSWGGPDLKFKNDTDQWVLVSVSYSSTSITIALYGTDPGYEVESSVGPWTSIKKYDTEEIKDPTMRKGARVVEDAGITGRTITVKRTVKRGGEVVRTDTFVSRYRPKVEVVRVGTKPPKKTAEPTATPTP